MCSIFDLPFTLCNGIFYHSSRFIKTFISLMFENKRRKASTAVGSRHFFVYGREIQLNMSGGSLVDRTVWRQQLLLNFFGFHRMKEWVIMLIMVASYMKLLTMPCCPLRAFLQNTVVNLWCWWPHYGALKCVCMCIYTTRRHYIDPTWG